MSRKGEQVMEQLLAAALKYPGAHEDHPWGETVVKVKGKIFLFLSLLGRSDGGAFFGCSMKLPHSGVSALMLLPFVQPMAYGLGKSGWVSARFKKGDVPPLPLLVQWLDESYRAVAPKKLVATLSPGARSASTSSRRRPR